MAEKSAGTKRRSAREWQVLVSKLAASGEEVTPFCRRQGIHVPTFRWWQWHLRGSAGELERRGRLSPAGPQPQFTELQVLEAPGPTGATGGFELRWPDGLTLAIPRQFDEVALRRLLVVLEVAGC